MKKLNKILSVGLSLAMCASMVVPSFAASFQDLQYAINGGEDEGSATNVIMSDNGDIVRYGYGANLDELGKVVSWGIEAWDDEEGVRKVQLNEDVEREQGEGSIVVKNGNVTLNMDGYTIDGNKESGSVIKVDGTTNKANLTINAGERTDENGEKKVGTITGGNSDASAAAGYIGLGGGVYVSGGEGTAAFTMNGGAITGNNAAVHGGGVAVVAGNVTLNGVTVEGNSAGDSGGGIFASDIEPGMWDSEAAPSLDPGYDPTGYAAGGLKLNDSVVKDNHAYQGGGITVIKSNDVTITGTEISENTATTGGGIIASESEITLDKVSIENNTGSWYGGGIYAVNNSEVTLKNNVSITKNHTDYYGGGIYGKNTTIKAADDSVIVIANNDAGVAADDIYAENLTMALPDTEAMDQKLDSDGKNITGWYWDAGDRWSHGDFAYYKYGSEWIGTAYAWNGYFKAAHGQYFNVIYKNGVGEDNGTQLQASEVENGSKIPGYGNETPTREGYDFIGWRLADDSEVDLVKGIVEGDLVLVAQWVEAEPEPTEPTEPTNPTDPTEPDPGIDIEDPDVPLGEEPDDEVEIEDPEVPLAGLFTRADAIGYLWEQTGSPDAELSDFPDVPEDHYWAVAIGWAQDMGIALPDEEGNFRPDDLVLRSSSEPEGELQQFLNRYAVFAGAAEQGESFIQLTGASDDIIMGEEAQVIFDEFFAKLEAALTRKAA